MRIFELMNESIKRRRCLLTLPQFFTSTKKIQKGTTTTATFNLSSMSASTSYAIDAANDRYPFCIVWTPIPMITWLLPFVGHMGICDSHGVIHDFAGPYFISRDNMAFGRPVKYWCLHPSQTATLESLRGGNPTPAATAGEAGRAVVPGPGEDHVEKVSLSVGGCVGASALTMSPNATVIDSSHRVAHQQSPPPPLTATDMWDAGVYRAAEMYRKMNYNFFCNNCHSFVGTALEQMELISLNNPYNNNRGLGASSPASSAATTASSSMLSARKEFLGGSSRGAGSSSPSPPGLAVQQPSRTIDHARRAVVGDTIIQLKTWNMVTIGAQIFFFGKYVSFGKFLLAHLPFFIIIAIVVSLGYMGSALSK